MIVVSVREIDILLLATVCDFSFGMSFFFLFFKNKSWNRLLKLVLPDSTMEQIR